MDMRGLRKLSTNVNERQEVASLVTLPDLVIILPKSAGSQLNNKRELRLLESTPIGYCWLFFCLLLHDVTLSIRASACGPLEIDLEQK